MTLLHVRVVTFVAGLLLVVLASWVIPEAADSHMSAVTFVNQILLTWRGLIAFFLFSLGTGALFGSLTLIPAVLFHPECRVKNVRKVFAVALPLPTRILTITAIAVLFLGAGKAIGYAFLFFIGYLYLSVAIVNLTRFFVQCNASRFDVNYRTAK